MAMNIVNGWDGVVVCSCVTSWLFLIVVVQLEFVVCIVGNQARPRFFLVQNEENVMWNVKKELLTKRMEQQSAITTHCSRYE